MFALKKDDIKKPPLWEEVLVGIRDEHVTVSLSVLAEGAQASVRTKPRFCTSCFVALGRLALESQILHL